MELKTSLTVKEFRDRFAHKTSPEWAIGSQTTPDGRFPSGKSDRKSFTLRVTKRNPHVLTPTAFGTVTETDDGCTLTWKIRRPNAGYGILAICAIVSGIMSYYFGAFAYAAVMVAWYKQPEVWSSAITLAVFTVLLAAAVVLCAVMAFYIPRKSRDRLTDHLKRVVGESAK